MRNNTELNSKSIDSKMLRPYWAISFFYLDNKTTILFILIFFSPSFNNLEFNNEFFNRHSTGSLFLQSNRHTHWRVCILLVYSFSHNQNPTILRRSNRIYYYVRTPMVLHCLHCMHRHRLVANLFKQKFTQIQLLFFVCNNLHLT